MQITIIRHGQSFNNALMQEQQRRVQDPPLTEVGQAQARAVARFLAETVNLEDTVAFKVDAPERTKPELAHAFPYTFTHLYCSPMLRALQTALPIGEALGMTPEVWVEIHEHGGIFLKDQENKVQGFGGMTRGQIVDQFPGYLLPDAITEAGWWNPADGMEPITGCYARAIQVASDLRRRAQSKETGDEKVVLVAHGLFIDCFLKALLQSLPTTQYYHWHYNTAITRVDLIEQGTVMIRYINRVTHLTPDIVT